MSSTIIIVIHTAPWAATGRQCAAMCRTTRSTPTGSAPVRRASTPSLKSGSTTKPTCGHSAKKRSWSNICSKTRDRKSVVSGKSVSDRVDLGGRTINRIKEHSNIDKHRERKKEKKKKTISTQNRKKK